MPQYTYRDSAPRKPFEEPGEYLVTIEEFEFTYATSGSEIMKLKLRTSGGALVYDNLVFVEAASWKIDHALKCFLPSKGFTPPAKDEGFDLNKAYANERLLGATGWVFLSKSTTPAGKTRNEVDAYLPPKKTGATQGTTTKATAPTPATSATSVPAPSPATDDDEIPF